MTDQREWCIWPTQTRSQQPIVQQNRRMTHNSHNSSTSWIICSTLIQIWNVYRLEPRVSKCYKTRCQCFSFSRQIKSCVNLALLASPEACTAFIFAAHTGWPAGASRLPPSCCIFFSGKPGVAWHITCLFACLAQNGTDCYSKCFMPDVSWRILMYADVSSSIGTSQYREHRCLCWRRSDFFSNASR